VTNIDNVYTFTESVVFTCFYFYVLFVLCVCILFDVFVLFGFLLLPCANEEMMMMTVIATFNPLGL